MTPVNFDARVSDELRRQRLYCGELFVYPPGAAARSFCEFAEQMIERAFPSFDPETAQDCMAVERYAAILSELKPAFIHHPQSKELLRELLREMGCDLDQTYFDVPRMRSSTSDGYLTSGIAYAWHPHRDTWFSAPTAQINWWMPIYPMEAGNGMAFHGRYFGAPVSNTSHSYNYYEWNAKHRRVAADNVKQENRPMPRATEPIDQSGDTVFVTPPAGIQMFSAAQLHSSIPNATGKTRFSIDFRTVHIGDIAEGKGARNVDAACTGSSIRDFIRANDFAGMPQEIVDMFNDGTEENAAELLYNDNMRSAHPAREEA